MASTRPHPLSIAFPIVAVASLTADEAEADAAFTYGGPYCQESGGYAPTGGYAYCDGFAGVDNVYPHNAAEIPSDGVLVLQASIRGNLDPAVAVGLIDATVTLGDTVVPGALEATSVPGWLVWRPQDPLAPGAYLFSATIDFNGAPPGCIETPTEFGFTVGDQPATPLVATTLTSEQDVQDIPVLDLSTLACCPGFAPEQNVDPCGGAPTLSFDPQQCTPLTATGSLHVNFTGNPAAEGPTAGLVLYHLNVDGSVWYPGFTTPSFPVVLDKPFCASVTTTNLATGETLNGPMLCLGNDVAAQLGVHDLEPPDSFTCSLRQCELQGNTWDLDACTPLDPNHPNEPEPAEDKACGCATDSPAAPAALIIAALAAIRRRRHPR